MRPWDYFSSQENPRNEAAVGAASMLGLAARNLELANRVAQSVEIASGDRQVMLGIPVSHDTRKHKLKGISRFNAAEKLSMVRALIVHGQTGGYERFLT